MKWKNIFVLCTGRCGSTTFAKAASHAQNYTAGHETRTHLVGPARFAYPEYHIEADNRLSWLLGRLSRTFGQEALYVHLTRARDDVAASFAKRADKGIMHAYRKEILMRAARLNKDATLEDFALDYIDTVTENIYAFLKDKPHKLTMRLEHADEDFAAFWEVAKLDGNLNDALSEWQIRYNSS